MDSTFSAASRSLRDSFSRLSSEARSFSSRSSKTKSPNCKQTPCPRGAAQLAAAPPALWTYSSKVKAFRRARCCSAGLIVRWSGS
jgi:hypothetical protein